MQYLISVIDDGQAEAAGDTYSATPQEANAVDVFNEKLQAGGYWVFGGGLTAPSDATTIDNRGAAPVVTDGPFVETKEFLAGFWVLDAPDLDAALALATEASKACNRKIEVRPFDSM
ncbi:MAG TPA: YciI family protein [Pseudolysinimonas sp.]|jgi:hypothetical protein